MHSETFAVQNTAPDTNPPRAAGPARRLRLAGAALMLAAACGLAHAADTAADAGSTGPAAAATTAAARIALTGEQLDQVAAGFQQSASAATASALLGFATTASTTNASVTGPIVSTGSTSVGVAGGIGAQATAGAGTRFR